MSILWIIIYFLFLGQINMNSAITMIERSTQTDAKNLTAITWAHAVNSQNELNEVLSSNIEMIEADIVLGTLITDINGTKIPVMGHPPAKTSDISLDSFLRQILKFNIDNQENRKGVKLDFKSTEVFEGSHKILNDLWPMMDYPIWLNADIIRGPVEQMTTLPVDPVAFFNGSKIFKNAVLSVGWTTLWGSNYTIGQYTDTQINEMIEAIKMNDITKSKHTITFPVRAGIAAQSLAKLCVLFDALNKTNNVTLTIWSSKNDTVDICLLRELIFSVGIDRIYLDVPEEVSSKLNLGNVDFFKSKSFCSNFGKSLIPSINNLLYFGIGLLLSSIYLRKSLF